MRLPEARFPKSGQGGLTSTSIVNIIRPPFDRRRESRRNSAQARFESEAVAFHRRVRAGYRDIARREPRRVKWIDAARPEAEVQEDLRRAVGKILPGKSRPAGKPVK